MEKIKNFLAVNYGDGSGDGSGSGYDAKNILSISGKKIYIIDNIPTIIVAIYANYAKGYIFRNDLTLKPCYIVKQGKTFAHGYTLREAVEALRDKIFENMPIEQRINEFIAAHKWGIKYPDKDYFEWHNRLTGSCYAGRMEFAAQHGLENLDGERTVEEFIALCRDSYGGNVIKALEQAYKEDT